LELELKNNSKSFLKIKGTIFFSGTLSQNAFSGSTCCSYFYDSCDFCFTYFLFLIEECSKQIKARF